MISSFNELSEALNESFTDFNFNFSPFTESFCAYRCYPNISYISLTFFNNTLKASYKNFRTRKTLKSTWVVNDNEYSELIDNIHSFINKCQIDDLMEMFGA